jgi:hypothetical protein
VLLTLCLLLLRQPVFPLRSPQCLGKIGGIREQVAKILPHEFIGLTNRHIVGTAPFFLMAVDGMPFAMTEIVRVRASRDPNARPSTQTDTPEGFQQVGMGGIVAGSSAGILSQLGLDLLEALLAHDPGNLQTGPS